MDFDLYSLIGYNPANVIEYVKTFVGAINAYFALIQQPRVQISIQAIDIYKVGEGSYKIFKNYISIENIGSKRSICGWLGTSFSAYVVGHWFKSPLPPR